MLFNKSRYLGIHFTFEITFQYSGQVTTMTTGSSRFVNYKFTTNLYYPDLRPCCISSLRKLVSVATECRKSGKRIFENASTWLEIRKLVSSRISQRTVTDIRGNANVLSSYPVVEDVNNSIIRARKFHFGDFVVIFLE